MLDTERLAFYCKQCHTMAEGGVIAQGGTLMVRCHGQVEEVHLRYGDVPSSATKDDPHLVYVFKKPAAGGISSPSRPNLRFYCRPDDKIIRDFLYQRDQSLSAQRNARVHVFVVKCVGDKCRGKEHHRAFSAASLSDKQLYGDGPPLLLDLDTSKAVPVRQDGDGPKATPDAVPAPRLPGVREAKPGKGKLPPTRLITLEED